MPGCDAAVFDAAVFVLGCLVSDLLMGISVRADTPHENPQVTVLFRCASLRARSHQDHERVHSAQRKRPFEARNRPRQYQRRATTCSGLRTIWAMKRISTIIPMSFV